MTAQHKASKRASLRSALKHTKLANNILDSLATSQTAFNALMDKIDADNSATLDVDYVSTQTVDLDFDPDATGTDAQHKSTFRNSLRKALSHKALADEILDAIDELEVTHNALLAKLDAEVGILNDTDYASALGSSVTDSDSPGSGAQHKVSFRVSLRSALCHRKLANDILDAISSTQGAMNSALAALDGDTGVGALLGLYVPFKVEVLNPDVK